MRAEIEGYPRSDSVRLTVLRPHERNSISAHGLTGGSVDTKAIEHTITVLWVWS